MAENALSGRICIKITSADIPGALELLTDHSIILDDIHYESDLSVMMTLSKKDFKVAKQLLEKRGDRCEISNKSGLFWTFLAIRSRWLLIAGCAFLVFLTIFIPSRLYFFEVKGNERIPSLWILENAEANGLSFGCKRSAVKSEEMKNNILGCIPELDWVGITTNGCVATIEVKEKPVEDKSKYVPLTVSHIVATCDSVVDGITVTKGSALCKPGQAVEKGQILISGYEDRGFAIKATQAEGEVYGKTIRTLNLITPTKGHQRGEKIRSERKYSIQIGKNIINFSKYSGISPPGCDKMYLRKYLTLPGGFQLPVALVCQELSYYETFESEPADDHGWLEQDAEQYIIDHMNAGQIILQHTNLQYIDGFCVLNGIYACREEIGRNKIEEILDQNGNYS